MKPWIIAALWIFSSGLLMSHIAKAEYRIAELEAENVTLEAELNRCFASEDHLRDLYRSASEAVDSLRSELVLCKIPASDRSVVMRIVEILPALVTIWSRTSQ